MTHWFFARHGESVANAEGWLSGWIDVDLTEAGLAGARARAEEVAALPIRRCLVSDLVRARRTAHEMLAQRRDVPVHTDAGLRERHLGVLQGRPRDEVVADPFHRLRLRTWHDAPEDGETHAAVVRRALATLRHWDDGTPTLVVAHGALIRDLLGVLDRKHVDVIMGERPAENCVIVQRRVRLADMG